MAAKPPPVLTADDYDQIVAQLNALKEIPAVMQRACATGVDCTEYEKMHDMSKAWLENALKVWFPKGRPK
jgi:hypothetical protein